MYKVFADILSSYLKFYQTDFNWAIVGVYADFSLSKGSYTMFTILLKTLIDERAANMAAVFIAICYNLSIIVIPYVFRALLKVYDKVPQQIIYLVICGPEVLSFIIVAILAQRLVKVLTVDEDNDDDQARKDALFKAHRLQSGVSFMVKQTNFQAFDRLVFEDMTINKKNLRAQSTQSSIMHFKKSEATRSSLMSGS